MAVLKTWVSVGWHGISRVPQGHLRSHRGRPHGVLAGHGRQGPTLRREPRHARRAAIEVPEDGPIVQVLKKKNTHQTPARNLIAWKKRKENSHVFGWLW